MSLYILLVCYDGDREEGGAPGAYWTLLPSSGETSEHFFEGHTGLEEAYKAQFDFGETFVSREQALRYLKDKELQPRLKYGVGREIVGFLILPVEAEASGICSVVSRDHEGIARTFNDEPRLLTETKHGWEVNFNPMTVLSRENHGTTLT